MKYIKIILVVILVITLLGGCASSNMELFKEADGYYLLMDRSTIDTEQTEYRCEEAPWLQFETIEEMLHDIKTGTFTDDERKEVEKFDRDEQGRVVLFDLDNVWGPVFPTGYDKISVIWCGSYYYVTGRASTAPGKSAKFTTMSPEYYAEQVEHYENLDKYLKSDNISVSKEKRDGIEVTVYDYSIECWPIYEPPLEPYFEAHRMCTYTLSDTDTELFICEYYDSDSDLKTPTSITIYGKSDDKYFNVYVTAFTTRPSPEWLLGFGIKPYST